MKKEIFLSFNPKYFKPLLYGLKKYEYRKRFCNEETIAYLYLSQKEKKVIGIMELGKPIKLDQLVNTLNKNSDVYKRVNCYIKNKNINAIPIKSLRLFKKPIFLEEIRKEIPKFMPPQMYYVLDNNQTLKNLMHKQKVEDPIFIHSHKDIYLDNLAFSCSNIEKTNEYREIDKIFNIK